MKKLLLVVVLLGYPHITSASDKGVYLKMDAITTSKIGGVKQYSLISPDVAAGVGYYLSEKYRVDLVAGKSVFRFDPQYIASNELTSDGSILSGTKRSYTKSHARYILFNNYIDIVTRPDFTIFANAGIGFAKIREKRSKLFSGMLIDGEIITIPLAVEKYKSKDTNRIIYSVGGGTGIRVHPAVNVDLTYNYKHFGKPKYNKTDSRHIASVKIYKSHNIAIGVRLDL